MTKFVEYINTTCVIGNFTTEWNELVKVESTIDIAGAHLTPDVAKSITQTIMNDLNVTVVDSTNKDRQALIDYNYKIREAGTETMSKPLRYSGGKDLSDFLWDFNESVTYDFSLSSEPDRILHPTALLLLLLRPEVNVTFNGKTFEFMKYLSKETFKYDVDKMLSVGDTYYITIGSSVYPVIVYEKDLNTKFKLYPIQSEVTVMELISNYFLVPKFIGTINVSKSNKLWDMWSIIVEDIYTDLDIIFKNERKSLIQLVKELC